MSFINDIAVQTRHPVGLLHPIERDVPRHALGSVELIDRGSRYLVNGVSTAATMVLAAPVVGATGLAARVITANRPRRFKALVAPAVPVGFAAGLVSGIISASVGTGAALVGAGMVIVGAAAYPVQRVSKDIAALAG